MITSAIDKSKLDDMDWYLTGCLPPDRQLVEVFVSTSSFVIGRRKEVDFRLSSQCVSSRHAEILRIGDHLFIRDLGSTNGTFVNRRRVRQPTPIADGDHIEIADVEFRLECRSNVNLDDIPEEKEADTFQAFDALENQWVLTQFNELIKTKAVAPHFQKIIDLNDRSTIGFEALARSSMKGLETPDRMFGTAELLDREVELSIVCRESGVETSSWCAESQYIFLNTHPQESLENDVLPTMQQIREKFPDRKMVLEIHEGAVQDVRKTRYVSDKLADMDIDIGYDDFGAGRSRLVELMKAPPKYLKFDRSLVTGIHEMNPYQWKMIKTLVDMAHDIGITTLAEGVEEIEEADACKEMGFQLAQGYFFGRPKSAELQALEETQAMTRDEIS